MKDQPTTVYRCYDVEGRLLYVGITILVTNRLARHQKDKVWWREAVRVELKHFDTRREAELDELHAIAHERPRWNLAQSNAAGPARPRQQLLFRDGTVALRRRRTKREQDKLDRQGHDALMAVFASESGTDDG